MTTEISGGPRHVTWSLDDIPFEAIGRETVQDDEHLFFTVVTASFVEITSDLYTANLAEYFSEDPEAVEWLLNHWEHEEVQHGVALRRYVETAWPEFDWEAAYRGFFDEYSRLCTIEQLAPGYALEFARRCVVETGTATFYRMLADYAPEPVLKQIAANISSDEVRHYKYFFKFFRRYREAEQPSQIQVAGTLLKRAFEVDSEDGYVAFKHAFIVRHPDREFDMSDYRWFRRGSIARARSHYPFGMAVKMFTKPLDLSTPTRKIVRPILSKFSRRASAH